MTDNEIQNNSKLSFRGTPTFRVATLNVGKLRLACLCRARLLYLITFVNVCRAVKSIHLDYRLVYIDLMFIVQEVFKSMTFKLIDI